MALTGLGLFGAPAGAQDEVDQAADSRVVRLDATYTVVPDEQLIDAVEIITISNVRPSSDLYYYFWRGHDIGIPADAKDLTITSDGQELSFESYGEPTPRSVVHYGGVEYPSSLLYGQSRTLEVRYQLPSDRSQGGQVRVNAAIFSGYLMTCCDFEDVDIKVIVPTELDVTPPDGYERTVEDGMQVFRFTATELEDGFTDLVVTEWLGVNEAAIERTELPVGGSVVGLVSLPDYPIWHANLSQFVPQLDDAFAELVGQDWLAADLDLEAGINPQFADDGWVDVDDSLIVVPDDYSDRAIALTLARRAGPDLGFILDDVEVGAHRLLAAEALGSTWSTGTLQSRKPADGGVIRSGSNAHWFAEELAGPQGWSGLVELAEFANSAMTIWPGPDGADDLATLPTDWRRIIDAATALERPEAIAVIEDFHLSDEDKAELAEHAERAAQLLEFQDETDRHAPVGIRRALTNWELDRADALIESARETLDVRDTLIEAAAGASLEIDHDLGPAWDAVEDEAGFAVVADGYENRKALIARLVQARAAAGVERGFVERLGFDQPAVDAQLAAAATGIEQDRSDDVEAALGAADDLVTNASSEGQRILATWIALAVGVLVLFVLAMWFWRRSRRRSRLAADAGEPAESARSGGTTADGSTGTDVVIDLADDVGEPAPTVEASSD